MRLSFVVVCLAAFSAQSVDAFVSSSSNSLFGKRGCCLSMTSDDSSVLNRLPDSAVEVVLKIPGAATKAAYEKAGMELSKTVSIPGFRKGSRIPPHMLEQMMSDKGGRFALRVQAINALLTKLLEPAIKQHGLEPLGQPTLTTPAEELAKDFNSGEPLDLVVRCDVWPDIQWKKTDENQPYIGLEGSYQREPFDQKKFEKALEDLRERYAVLETSDSILAMGDACRVNMVGYMAAEDGTKGDPLPNTASGDDVEIIMGEGRYMKGLVEGLIGAKVGDTRTITVSFPEKLRDKTLAGKKAIFDVTILETSHRSLPEVNDEFANKVRPGLTAEALKDELIKAVDAEDAKKFVGVRNAALSKALASVMEVEVPDTLVTNQAREKYALMMTEMRDNGVADDMIKSQITPENFQKYKDIERDDIVRDFKVSMACDEIARLEGIEVPDYQVEEQLQAIRKDAEKHKEEFDEKMIRAKVGNALQRQMVFDFLAENSKLDIEYVEEAFNEELMNQLAEESLARQEKLAEEAAQR